MLPIGTIDTFKALWVSGWGAYRCTNVNGLWRSSCFCLLHLQLGSFIHLGTEPQNSLSLSNISLSFLNWPFTASISLFSSFPQLTVNMLIIKFCWWLDYNHGPLVSEATILPTEAQPLPYISLSLTKAINKM